MKSRLTSLPILLLLAVLLGLAIRATTVPVGLGDSDKYEAVARSVGVLVHPPWGYRIGIPYLAAGFTRATGLGLASSFVLLQILLYAGLLVATFLWAGRAFNLGRSGAMLGTIGVLVRASRDELNDEGRAMAGYAVRPEPATYS